MEYSPEELDLVNQYGKTAEGIDLKKRIDDLASRRSSDPSNWFSYQDQIKSLNDQYKQGYTKYIEDYKSQQSSPPASPTPGGGDSELNEYGDLLDSLKDSKNSTANTPQQEQAPRTPAQTASMRAKGLQERLRAIQAKRNAQRARTASSSSSRPTPQQLQQQIRERAARLMPERNPAQTGRERVAQLRARRAQGGGSNLRVGYGREAARRFL